MKVDTLADLRKLVRECRKLGISNITVDGLTINLGHEMVKASKAIATDADTIETENISDENILFWSSAPTLSNEG